MLSPSCGSRWVDGVTNDDRRRPWKSRALPTPASSFLFSSAPWFVLVSGRGHRSEARLAGRLTRRRARCRTLGDGPSRRRYVIMKTWLCWLLASIAAATRGQRKGPLRVTFILRDSSSITVFFLTLRFVLSTRIYFFPPLCAIVSFRTLLSDCGFDRKRSLADRRPFQLQFSASFEPLPTLANLQASEKT